MVDKKPKILIVDDEPVVCDVLSDELSERGYLCTRAFNARDALTKLETEDFDVVLLDIRLPEMSGMKVLSKIRSNHHNSAAIVIRVDSSIGKLLQTKKRLPERRDKQATEKSPTEMDAIARGVEARLESLFGFSKIVTQETVDIARGLDIPEKEIQKWAALKAGHDAKTNAAMKSSLNKLGRSAVAQMITGITLPYLCAPKPDESQN